MVPNRWYGRFAASVIALLAGSAIAQTPVLPDIGPLPLSLPEAQVGIAYNPPPDEFQRAIAQAIQEVPEVSLRVSVDGNPPPGISVSGLRAADPGRIEAIVPYGLTTNASQQIVVRRSNSLSMPESIAVAAGLPALYTRDGSGSGEAAALAVKPDGTQIPVTVDSPAAPGDELILTCTGLGEVDPAIDTGAAAPAEPRARTVNPVGLTIGGRSVEVTFSGLTPGLAGVYQVNAIIPADLEASAASEVILTAAGQSSAPVTIAIQPRSE